MSGPDYWEGYASESDFYGGTWEEGLQDIEDFDWGGTDRFHRQDGEAEERDEDIGGDRKRQKMSNANTGVQSTDGQNEIHGKF